MIPREPREAELIMPCPWCSEEGYDAVYMDEDGVSRHTICRNDVRTETIERFRAPNLHSGIGEEGCRHDAKWVESFTKWVIEAHEQRKSGIGEEGFAAVLIGDVPWQGSVAMTRQEADRRTAAGIGEEGLRRAAQEVLDIIDTATQENDDTAPLYDFLTEGAARSVEVLRAALAADKDSQPARDGLRRDIPRVKEGDPNARLPYFDVATLIGGAAADTPTEPEPLDVDKDTVSREQHDEWCDGSGSSAGSACCRRVTELRTPTAPALDVGRLAAAIWKVYPFPGSKPVRADIERIAAEYAALSATTEINNE